MHNRCAAGSSDRGYGEHASSDCGFDFSPDFCTHHVAQKRFEHHECPQHRAIVAPTRLMVIDQSSKAGTVEPACVSEYRPEYGVAHGASERPAKPCAEWDRKAHFG